MAETPNIRQLEFLKLKRAALSIVDLGVEDSRALPDSRALHPDGRSLSRPLMVRHPTSMSALLGIHRAEAPASPWWSRNSMEAAVGTAMSWTRPPGWKMSQRMMFLVLRPVVWEPFRVLRVSAPLPPVFVALPER